MNLKVWHSVVDVGTELEQRRLMYLRMTGYDFVGDRTFVIVPFEWGLGGARQGLSEGQVDMECQENMEWTA